MLFVFDLDGVIYRELQVVKGAVETTKYLQRKGHTVTYATNNALLSRRQYLVKLKGMGFDVKLDEIMCAAGAAGDYLWKNGGKKNKVFVIGEKGLKSEVKSSGAILAGFEDPNSSVDYVVAGLDRNFTYKKLYKAQQYVLGGAKLIATNKDATYPAANNRTFPGCGSIIAALEAACGREAFVLGKPLPYMLDRLFELTGYRPEKTIVVGDRVETDILFGKSRKTTTVLVLTGITAKQDVLHIRKEMKPDIVLKSMVLLRKMY